MKNSVMTVCHITEFLYNRHDANIYKLTQINKRWRDLFQELAKKFAFKLTELSKLSDEDRTAIERNIKRLRDEYTLQGVDASV